MLWNTYIQDTDSLIVYYYNLYTQTTNTNTFCGIYLVALCRFYINMLKRICINIFSFHYCHYQQNFVCLILATATAKLLAQNILCESFKFQANMKHKLCSIDLLACFNSIFLAITGCYWIFSLLYVPFHMYHYYTLLDDAITSDE